MKNVIKEICIAILLGIACLLIFAIVFYEYVPVNKFVPEKVEYSIPANVKAELGEDLSIKETQPQQITYSVTNSDLQQYKDATVYQPGNQNPFIAIQTGTQNLIINETGGETTEDGTISGNGIQYHYQQGSSGGSSLK